MRKEIQMRFELKRVKGRGSIHSERDCERKRRKAAEERPDKKQGKNPPKKRRKGRKNFFPTGYPVSPVPKMIKRYRHTCGNCPETFVADSQEAFCRYCGSNALTITDVLENS
jgi:hypothetical protein